MSFQAYLVNAGNPDVGTFDRKVGGSSYLVCTRSIGVFTISHEKTCRQLKTMFVLSGDRAIRYRSGSSTRLIGVCSYVIVVVHDICTVQSCEQS